MSAGLAPGESFWSFQGLRPKLKVISELGVVVGAIATPLHTTAYNIRLSL